MTMATPELVEGGQLLAIHSPDSAGRGDRD